jgi:rod shape-determining protein MreD
MLTVALAMVLGVAHLPETTPQWLGWLRPDWVVLVVFYWVMATPHRLGLIAAWVIGLLLDVLLSQPLGLNGLCLAALTFVTWSFYERFRMYSITQQGAVIFLMVLGIEIVRQAAEVLTSDAGFTWGLLLPGLISMVLWPPVYLVLRELRRQFSVE